MSEAAPRPPRLLYVGGSHMIAHKLAHDEGAGQGRAEITFRGLAGREIFAIEATEAGLRVDPARLLRPNAKKPLWCPIDSVVDYGPFDAFAVVGAMKTVELVRAARMIASADERYSQNYLRAGVTALVEEDHGLALGAAIARQSGKPTLFVCPPLPAVAMAERAATAKAVLDEVEERLRSACEGRSVAYVPLPREALVDYCATREEFARGSVAYHGKAHHEEERAHMNARYGAIALRQVLDALEGMGAGEPVPAAQAG